VWDDSSRLTIAIFKGMWNMFAFCCNMLGSLFNSILSAFGMHKLKSSNDEKRGVQTSRQPVPLTELLQSLAPCGKVVISGNDMEHHSPWRNAVTARTVLRNTQMGVGAIVLHSGNIDLVARLQSVLPPERIVIVDNGNKVYDPFRDLTPMECVEVLTGSDVGRGCEITSDVKTYIEGLILCARYCRGNVPSMYRLRRLVNTSLSSLQDQLQRCLDMRRITQEQYDECHSLLVGGISGRMKARIYINELSDQFANAMVDSGDVRDSDMISIGRAFRDGKILVMDVQCITRYSVGYGILMNELNKALNRDRRGYLVIDNLEIVESDEMFRRIVSTGVRLGVCISTPDLFAKCAGKQERFNTVVGGSERCFVFKHSNGDSAEAWQKHFGTYEKIEVVHNDMRGKMKSSPFVLFGGNNSGQGNVYQPKLEFRVRSNDIQMLPQGVVYMSGGNTDSICHCALEEA